MRHAAFATGRAAPEAPDSPGPRSRIADLLCLAALVYGALVCFPPAPFSPTRLNLDGAYRLALNMAHAQGLVHGRDVVFTFGPMGFLLFPSPLCGSPELVRAYALVMYGLVCLLMLASQARDESVTARLAIVVTVVAVQATATSPHQVPLVMALLVICADPDRRPWDVLAMAGLGTLTAVGLLQKANVGVQGVALLAMAAVHRTWSRGWRSGGATLAALSALPVTLALLGARLNGGVSTLPSYLRRSLEVAAGYTEGITRPGSGTDLGIGLALTTLPFLVVPAIARDLRSVLPAFAPAAALAFLAFKHAFVRQDAGHVAAHPAYLAIGALLLLVRARHPRDRILIAAVLITCLGVAVAWHVQKTPDRVDATVARLRLAHLRPGARAFADWQAHWARAGETARASLAPAALPPAVREVVARGTVDVLPWSVPIVAASGLSWKPRPVFQSYAAYTPVLDRLNARVLEARSGPDTVIVHEWGEIDDGHPFLVGCQSWRALVDRYRVVAVAAAPLVLRRGNEPRFGTAEPVSGTTVGWGETLAIPAIPDVVLGHVDIDLSLLGAAANVAFRVTPVYLTATYDEGPPRRWRVTRATLAGGFIASHLPRTMAEARRMLTRPDTAPRVTSMTFETDRPSLYGRSIRVQWSCLPPRSTTRG